MAYSERRSPLIGQACVIGDGRRYNTALLVLDPDVAPAWAARQGIDGDLPALARDEREVNAVLDIIEAHKGIKFEREYDLCGGCSLDKHGIASTEEVLEKSVKADAVFFGSAGGPEWGTSQPNPESGLLRVRMKMQVRGVCF